MEGHQKSTSVIENVNGCQRMSPKVNGSQRSSSVHSSSLTQQVSSFYYATRRGDTNIMLRRRAIFLDSIAMDQALQISGASCIEAYSR